MTRAWAALLVAIAGACEHPPIADAPSLPPGPAPLASEPVVPPSPPATEPERACALDADCGYDPVAKRCLADPRANRQPPIVDQGILCFCDDARCGTLVVPPVPCESDASCAVRTDPRPHPVAADATHPHERGRPCRDFIFSTTCERTNICTMHRLSCKKP